MAKKKVPYFKSRIQKRINNLSRAINKIEPSLQKSVLGMGITIQDVKAGVNTIKFIKNGREQEVRYDQIENLPQGVQSSLVKTLSVDRYNLRQERALQQLQEKGKISAQFKRSLGTKVVEDGKTTYTGPNPTLLKSIEEFEKKFEGNKKEVLQEEFEKTQLLVGEDWFEEADEYFQGKDGSPNLFDFYRPGESGGFTELNVFTWNIYKVERGF